MPASVSRATGSRRQRDGLGPEKDAKRPKVETKAEPGAGVNGASVPPPSQHVIQHGAQPVSAAPRCVRSIVALGRTSPLEMVLLRAFARDILRNLDVLCTSCRGKGTLMTLPNFPRC